MFQRLAVVNRGESAMRLIHAVRDLNAAAVDGHRIEVVALHTEAERSAMFVREADHAYDLGPAANRPYLDHAVLERALHETGADAAWVGWGFVAEDPAFAELCGRLGVTFVGPSPEAMRRLGDKIGSKLIAEEVGVPVAPWSRGGVDTLDDAVAAAGRIGYPLMLKATAGGGGRGIRRVDSDADLADAYTRTREEAERAFGSGVVFLEKLVTGARHVEVQVIADGQGTAWAIGVRDCSVQRRNQKVIEESASPVLDPAQAQELKDAAERLALAVGYAGAGTVEFLYHPGERFFAFLEVNTRLQVEHPITEVVTRTDLVRLQLHVAAGGRLTGERPTELGHAVEARLNAEDPDRDFAPAPGRIAHLELPAGPGIRVDTGVAEGDSIPADFDSMIAKIIAYGRDRDEALARLRRAMRETVVVIEGGATNKSFILDLLDQPEVVGGTADTGWIDRVRGEGRLVAHAHSGVALVAAGIEAYEEAEAIERTRLLETARGGRPQVQHDVGRAVDLKLRGVGYRVTVHRTGPARFRVGVADAGGVPVSVDADVERVGPYASRLQVGGRTHRLVTANHGPVQLVEVDGVTHRVSRDEGGVLRSPAPALVVATPVPQGAAVTAGSPVIVLESMKMETVLSAPFAARVKELLVAAGSQVETGAPLLRLDPTGDAEEAASSGPAGDAPDLDLPAEQDAHDVEARASHGRRALAAMLLGYDLDPGHEQRTLAAYLDARDALAASARPPVAAETELLAVLADVAELSRNRPVEEEAHLENRVHSPREHFHTYLQTLDPERGGLPPDFVTRLERVLAHYGVVGTERTPRLEQAVFRVFLAQQRSAPEVAMATAVLQRWLAEPAPEPPHDAGARELLDRLVAATQLRFPVVGDLARSVRFRWFDQPVVDAERVSVLESVDDELEAIDTATGADRTARVDALAGIPERIVRVLAIRLRQGVRDREPMLEVLVKRHYREHQLHDLVERTEDGRAVASASYRLDDRDSHLVSTVATVDELTPDSALAGTLGRLLDTRPSGHEGVVDLYLHWGDAPTDGEAASSVLRERLARMPFAHSARRVAVGVVTDDDREVAYYTFRPQDDGSLPEDLPVRGVHPMVGRRLNLWRLRDFDITRLDAPEDVLLLRAVARGNPQDQRLVALAQVRQFVVGRDDTGRVTGLPHVERALANCMEAVRRARTSSPDVRFDMNHVWLHIWPPVEADLDQLTALQAKIAPMTAGAGVEEVRVEGRVAGDRGHTVPVCARFWYQPGSGVTFTVEPPPTTRLAPLDAYAEKVVRARRRGVVYPYELVSMVAGGGGTAQELDLDESGALVPVDRPYGENTAGIICGVVTTPT
ncbi:MAG: biotin carboxylase N-terminal domain-containing protein, partial [Dermatophilaceae bacterium]